MRGREPDRLPAIACHLEITARDDCRAACAEALTLETDVCTAGDAVIVWPGRAAGDKMGPAMFESLLETHVQGGLRARTLAPLTDPPTENQD